MSEHYLISRAEGTSLSAPFYLGKPYSIEALAGKEKTIDFYVSDSIRFTPANGIPYITGISGTFNDTEDKVLLNYDQNGWYLYIKGNGSITQAVIGFMIFNK